MRKLLTNSPVFSILLAALLLIKFLSLLLSRATIHFLEILVSRDLMGAGLLLVGQISSQLDPIVFFLEYLIAFLFCAKATPILVRKSGLLEIHDRRNISGVILFGLCYLTFVYGIWLGRAPAFLAELTNEEQLLAILVLLAPVISGPILVPYFFLIAQAHPFGIVDFEDLQIRQTLAYMYLFAAGMAMVLRLGGMLELVALVYILLEMSPWSKKETIQVEDSVVKLLSGVDSNSPSFAMGFVILTGVYLGTQTLFIVRLQLTFFYTVFKVYADPYYILYYILPLALSIFASSFVPVWWLQRSDPSENFRRISGLYAILIIQLASLLWLGTYVDTGLENSKFTLQNPNIVSVLLAGCIVVYAFLRENVGNHLVALGFALMTIIFLGNILADYRFMSDINVLVWCAASYWFPLFLQILGEVIKSIFNAL